MTDMTGAPPPRPTSFRAGPPTQRLATDERGVPYEQEAPSRALAGRATATHVDARGRAITARKLNLLDYYRLAKLLGEDAKNERQMDLASIVVSVTEIDGDQVIFPVTPKELEHLIQRLDFDGMAAAGEALRSLNPIEAPEDTAKN